jgi:hypothetical protein
MNNKLYVGNLPFSATEAEINKLFGGVGQVSRTSIVTDRETGRPRGFAFVETSPVPRSPSSPRKWTEFKTETSRLLKRGRRNNKSERATLPDTVRSPKSLAPYSGCRLREAARPSKMHFLPVYQS